MNSDQYFATLDAWKQAYAAHTTGTQELKIQLKQANHEFGKLQRGATIDIIYHQPQHEYHRARRLLADLQAERLRMRATGRELIEQRAVLKEEATIFWKANATA